MHFFRKLADRTMSFFDPPRTRKGLRGEILPEQNEGAPDSHRPSGLCPRCGKPSSFDVHGTLPVAFEYGSMIARRDGGYESDPIERVASLICRRCKQGMIVVEEQYAGETPSRIGRSTGVITFRGFHWWPLPVAQVSSDVPAAIASAFSEAVTALAANCPRAAAVMARRTLEAIAAEKGESGGRLVDRIKTLASKGVLQPALADWATEVRLIGNAGAHFDPLDEVSNEDAQQLINLIRELTRYLYELPADLARRRTPKP